MASNVERVHVRFNLDDELHKKVYNYLEKFDANQGKSKNQFIIEVLDSCFDKLYDEKNPEHLITRRELVMFRKETETLIRDEIIRCLSSTLRATSVLQAPSTGRNTMSLQVPGNPFHSPVMLRQTRNWDSGLKIR